MIAYWFQPLGAAVSILAGVICAAAWLLVRHRARWRRRSGELESQSGGAVLLFSAKGELLAMGPEARRLLGLDGRVDPLRAADLPIEGLAAHLRALAAGRDAGVAAGCQLLTPAGPRPIEGSFAPLDPRRGALPAAFAFSVSAPPPRGVLSGARILLADDSKDGQLLLRHFLRGAGAEVEIVENGAQAVERAQRARFHAVFLDMDMPVMDGFEAAARIRRVDDGVPIIALTAHVGPEVERRCLAAGCSHFASKPVRRQPFLELAARVTASARAGAAVPDDDQLLTDPEFRMLIAEFVHDLDSRLAAMRAACAGGRWEELERLAHRLKGAAGSFGLPEISEISSELEASVRSDLGRAAAAGTLDRLADLMAAAAERAAVSAR